MSILVVADDEYNGLSNAYVEYAQLVETKYESYVSILSTICANAISDGEVFTNLQAFRETAYLLQGQFASVVEPISKYCASFVTDVDVADEYVY
jgi:uncharacterized membrane protein